MSELLSVGARRNGALIEFYDTATGRTLDFSGASPGNHKLAVSTLATLAQINAGLVIIPDDPNRTVLPIGFRLKFTGTFTTLTDIRLSDTAGVDIVTVAQANCSDGNVVGAGGSTGTFGSFGVALTPGKGVQIRKTGASGLGGTSVAIIFEYILV
jgi:hypothetical protein